MRILVTGATGFIGTHTVRRLLSSGCEVHCISRRQPSDLTKDLQWWQADLTDADSVQRLFSRVSPHVVVHLASEVTGERGLERVLPIANSNLISAINVLVAATRHGSCRVVMAGSLEEPRDDETTPIPGSPYAAAKWAATGYARMFHALYGLDIVIARIGMTYGPGHMDARKLVPYVAQCLLRGESPLVGDGRRAVDWVYVEDVAEALALACTVGGIAGKLVELGTGRATTVREIVARLYDLIDPTLAPQFGAVAERPLERDWLANADQTEQILGWRARTSLADGLAATVAWYRERLQFDRPQCC